MTVAHFRCEEPRWGGASSFHTIPPEIPPINANRAPRESVSVHRDHIKEKLGFATSAEMIRQAVRYVETDQMNVAEE